MSDRVAVLLETESLASDMATGTPLILVRKLAASLKVAS